MKNIAFNELKTKIISNPEAKQTKDKTDYELKLV